MILNNERYIFCYCILDYDDIYIFDLNVYDVSFFIISLKIYESAKEIYKEHCPILIKTSIGKNKIRIIESGIKNALVGQ